MKLSLNSMDFFFTATNPMKKIADYAIKIQGILILMKSICNRINTRYLV